MIIKSDHIDNYTVVANKVYQGSGLSFRAMGLMGYLLSKPSDWKVLPEAISKDTGESVSMVRKVLNELKSKGFAKLLPRRNKLGSFIGSEWVVYESLRDDNRYMQNAELGKDRALKY